MTNKFIVTLTKSTLPLQLPGWFDNFYQHCSEIAHNNNWHIDTVANYKLRTMGGRLIKTKTQGWYLRWDNESAHTAFVLKWT